MIRAEKCKRCGGELRKLTLLVPDSGRTVSVMYGEIENINPDDLQMGDVLIVRHETESGVMFMQTVERLARGWRLEALAFEDELRCGRSRLGGCS